MYPHDLLFSDNVSLEDEIALKKYARDHGLLLMGPGAGTTILNNVALGFANVLPRGPAGIVSAAGTGLQEVTTLLARHGVGISQGLGTGGRDLKKEVGGIMMLEALKALQQDEATSVIVLISKPPADEVVQLILDQVSASVKPAVICFLGGDLSALTETSNVLPAHTLYECALLAARLVRPEIGNVEELLESENIRLAERAGSLKTGRRSNQRYLRGLFSLALARELADALGGELGATRPLTEEMHWLPEHLCMALSGVQVKPELYVGLGVSGQIQHRTGVRGAKVVCAVNRDENAPIFALSDFGIVGSLYEVVPKIIAELKK